MQSLWNRNAKFSAISIDYPYCGEADGDEDELIAMLEADHEAAIADDD